MTFIDKAETKSKRKKEKLRSFFQKLKCQSASTESWLEVIDLPEIDNYLSNFFLSGEKRIENIEDLPFKVVDKIVKHISYDIIIRGNKNGEINEEFIRRYSDYINWTLLIYNWELPERLLRERLGGEIEPYNLRDYKAIEVIFAHQNVSEDFIFEFIDREKDEGGNPNTGYNSHWHSLSGNEKISESFLIENQDKLCWRNVSNRRNLSIDFIGRFKDAIDWRSECVYENFELKDLKSFKDSIVWDAYSCSPNIPEDVVDCYGGKLDWSAVLRRSKNRYSSDVLNKYSYKFNKDDWDYISSYADIDYDFVMKNINKLDLDKLKQNRKLKKNSTEEQSIALNDMFDIRNIFI